MRERERKNMYIDTKLKLFGGQRDRKASKKK
jgi:hypothetical protein